MCDILLNQDDDEGDEEGGGDAQDPTSLPAENVENEGEEKYTIFGAY